MEEVKQEKGKRWKSLVEFPEFENLGVKEVQGEEQVHGKGYIGLMVKGKDANKDDWN